MECPFCDKKIINKQKIFETNTEYVLHNIRPGKNKGRCLVLPKRHVRNIRELSESEAASLFNTVKLVSSKLNQYLSPAGFNYGLNEGKLAGQAVVGHLHFHIIPRYKDDKLPEFHIFHRHPKKKKNLSDKELEPFVKKFRQIFGSTE